MGVMVAGCRQEPPETKISARSQPRALAESEALAIARGTLLTNGGPDWVKSDVVYRARLEGRSWLVSATIIDGTNDSGEPVGPVGGLRIVSIDENGAITHILRGR